MLYVFGFDSMAVVACDLYFFDPTADQGAEQGVRLELRLLERGTDADDIFAAGPVSLGRPVWRVDLLESVEHPGTLDRAHHHPAFDGWKPCEREFVADMADDPVAWLAGRLGDLSGPSGGAGPDVVTLSPTDADELRRCIPEIRGAVERLLDGVRAGRLGQPAEPLTGTAARVGWL